MSDALQAISVPLLNFVLLLLVFAPLEKCFPAKPQAFLRPGFGVDLCFFLGQSLLWNALVFSALTQARPILADAVPEGWHDWIHAQPVWLQVLELVLLSDFLIYWGHRLQHRVPFLWRFHSVHHSADHLDWLAAHREHPVDTLYTVGLINLPAFLAGFDLTVMTGFIAFRGIWAVYIHSNVKLSLGPLRVLVGAPELHHWHHDTERFAGNYANLSPLMDVLFGTYRHPGHEPQALGLSEPLSRNYLAQLLFPLLPERLLKAIRRHSDAHWKTLARVGRMFTWVGASDRPKDEWGL